MSKRLPFRREVRARFRKVRDAILAEPYAYDQQSIYWDGPKPSCNSPVCIGGWLHYVTPKHEREATAIETLIEAVESRELANRIFAEQGFLWPEPFCTQFAQATNAMERAKIAAARIDYLLATGK